MTAHELAKVLLEMCDLPVGVYNDSDDVVEATQVVNHKIIALNKDGEYEVVDGFLIY
jgi:hypothetical protein